MFVLLCFDIGNERWTTSGFLTRLSNGGPPQVPGTHAGTRVAREFDGIIAAVKEGEVLPVRDRAPYPLTDRTRPPGSTPGGRSKRKKKKKKGRTKKGGGGRHRRGSKTRPAGPGWLASGAVPTEPG